MIPLLENPRVIRFMQENNMRYLEAELKCPKCGQVLKALGARLKGWQLGLVSHHLGTVRCLTQLEQGRVFSNEEWRVYSHYSRNCEVNRPKCLCGCGLLVSKGYNKKSGKVQWSKYFIGHYNKSDEFKELMESIRNKTIIRGLERLKSEMKGSDSIVQSDFRQLIGSSSTASNIIKTLFKAKKIIRKRIVYNGRWTYRITLKP